MEFSERPQMAKFTAAVATRVVSPDGSQCMNFEPGQTRSVPKSMFGVAIAAGLMPEEPLEKDAISAEVAVDKRSQEEIVMEGLVEACKQLIARGNPNDFTVVGQPRAASVKKLVDFEQFTARDVHRAFEQATSEVENGNHSTEHTESSSSDSE